MNHDQAAFDVHVGDLQPNDLACPIPVSAISRTIASSRRSVNPDALGSP